MKKLLTILCITGIIAFGYNESQAQDTRFGIKGGATMYSMKTSAMGFDETSSNKIGFAAGLFVEKPLSDMFSLQFEALYVQKGGEDEDDFFGDESITLSYVDIPVLLRVNIPIEGNVSPYVYGGLFAGYLIDASVEEDGVSMEIDDMVKDFNYGLSFGAGVSFGMLSLDIRYDLGLANIFETEFDDDFGDFFGDLDFEVTTSGLMLTAGISF